MTSAVRPAVAVGSAVPQGAGSARHYRMLDLTRALAAALVVLTHVGYWTGVSGKNESLGGPLVAHGDVGVAVFFAISAFLLLRPYVRAGLIGTSPPALRQYMIRRVGRILPAYGIALGAVLLVATLAPQRTGGIGSTWNVVRHLLLLQGYSDDKYQSFSQTWSLSTEVTFYVLVPAVGTALGRIARIAWRGWSAVGITVVTGLTVQGLTAAWIQADSGSPAGVIGLSVVGHAAWFAVGAAVALLSVDNAYRALPPVVERWLDFARSNPGPMVLGAGLLYLTGCTGLTGPVNLQPLTAGQAVVKEGIYTAIAGALVLAATSATRGVLADAAAKSPLRRWLGDASYPLFLWHVLVLQVLYLLTGRALFTGAFTWTLAVTLTVSLVLARASVNFIERPIMNWIHRLT